MFPVYIQSNVSAKAVLPILIRLPPGWLQARGSIRLCHSFFRFTHVLVSVVSSKIFKATTDPELGLPLTRLEASLGPLGLWDQDTDSLRVLLIAETFVRVREAAL